jgi:REP element-mobilizing transposase RayT
MKAKQKGLHVIHYSIESNHLHLFVEAKDNLSLASGMNSFGARFAKVVRNKLGGSGPVFDGRYHVKIMKSPRQVKNALAYVLLNHSKHEKLIPYLDTYSSAAYFRDWPHLLASDIGPILRNQRALKEALPDHLSEARSWLARAGWRKAC